MLVIPAIDLKGGRCVRLVQGDLQRETVYGDDPVRGRPPLRGRGRASGSTSSTSTARSAGRPCNDEAIARDVRRGAGRRSRSAAASATRRRSSACSRPAPTGSSSAPRRSRTRRSSRPRAAGIRAGSLVGIDARDGQGARSPAGPRTARPTRLGARASRCSAPAPPRSSTPTSRATAPATAPNVAGASTPSPTRVDVPVIASGGVGVARRPPRSSRRCSAGISRRDRRPRALHRRGRPRGRRSAVGRGEES